MLGLSRYTLAASVLLGSLSFVGCSDDDEPMLPKDPIVAVPEELPAPPSSQQLVPAAQATKTVYFAFDDYTLSGDAQASLNVLSDFMKGSTTTVVQIEGHCDERGSIEYNLALGERRAQSVKNYLVQLGVDPSRLPTISFGEEKPAAAGSNETSWAKNRRAEFVVSAP